MAIAEITKTRSVFSWFRKFLTEIYKGFIEDLSTLNIIDKREEKELASDA
jgi:hypothetical protein